MTHKLIETLERDIRNQVLIDSFKRITWKDRLMVFLEDAVRIRHVFWCMVAFWLIFGCLIVRTWAAECPNPGEPCRVVIITQQEEKLLMGQNGVLDTAAQARALDLGQFVVYFKQKIATAPTGEIKPTGVTDPPLKHDAPETAK